MQLKEPLSSEGVGLLIVDYKDLTLPDGHTVITFPASFAETKEPMIVTAALVQLGAKAVTRLMPTNPVTIEQVETQVVRFVLYRDQYPGEWTQVADRPVKTIRSLESLKDLAQADILDCWDRQFMNKNFQKVKPAVAEIFSVTCRLTTAAATIALQANAQAGLFTEPRAQHGRDPCPLHKVVWLPKKNFAEVLVAQQVTEVTTAIARSGDRFGLRTSSDKVQQVHLQNRPGIAYLDNSMAKQYQVSPLPFGTTKQSLQKVCDTWKWSARPSHTLGLTADKSGLIWVVSASEPPTYWIWTMTHGDVLITEMEKKHVLPPIKEQPVIASQKTLQHLLDKASQQPSKAEGGDLWLANDPWKPVPSSISGTGITNSQIATMEANIERKLKSSIQDMVVSTKASDDPMDPDAEARIHRLESQVTQLQDSLTGLTNSVGSFQQQQSTVNQQMSQQVQQLKSHLDNQTQTVQSMLDSKLEDQMSRIERLLSLPEKRAKTGSSHEWPPVPNAVLHAKWSNRFIRCLLLAFIIIRVGEASNPGPATTPAEAMVQPPGLTIGVVNPHGLLRKSANLLDLPSHSRSIWNISETHLTTPGIAKFRVELASQKTDHRLHHGAPTPHRSEACASIGGTHLGTAFVTNLASRKLQPMWTHDEWMTSRFTMNTFLYNQTWIQGAVIYGYAYRASTNQVKADTDSLLEIATRRIVLNATGCRYIAGDFNQESDLPQVELWRKKGWKEVQEIFASRTGRQPMATCYGKTRKDFLWISPELQPYLELVEVVSHVFPDHAALVAHFKPFGAQEYQYHWRKPKPISWKDIPKLPDHKFQTDFSQTSEDICKDIAAAFEDRIHTTLEAKQLPGLHPSQRGRCHTLTTTKIPLHTKPIKPS